MKKIVHLGLLSLCVFTLGACNKERNQTIPTKSSSESINDGQNSFESSSLSQAEWIEKNGPKVSYQDNLLSTPQGDFKFTGTGTAATSNELPVLVLTFDYTNTTEEPQIIENLLWDYLNGKQNLGDTTETTGYLIFTEESPFYPEYHKTTVEVNPGATVSAAYSYVLVDPLKPLTIEFLDTSGEKIASKDYKLN